MFSSISYSPDVAFPISEEVSKGSLDYSNVSLLSFRSYNFPVPLSNVKELLNIKHGIRLPYDLLGGIMASQVQLTVDPVSDRMSLEIEVVVRETGGIRKISYKTYNPFICMTAANSFNSGYDQIPIDRFISKLREYLKNKDFPSIDYLDAIKYSILNILVSASGSEALSDVVDLSLKSRFSSADDLDRFFGMHIKNKHILTDPSCSVIGSPM